MNPHRIPVEVDFPANTLVEVKRLVDPRCKLEVSAIAVVPT